MKRRKTKLQATLALILLAALLLPTLASCRAPQKDGKISVVCTTFPLYDWAKNIIGDSENITLELIVKNGTDIHSFQPSVADIAKISSSDLLVHIGGGTDKWVTDASKSFSGKLLTLSETNGIKLCSTDGSSHEHKEDDDHTHSEFDEHIWLTPKNAATASVAIAAELCRLDSKNTEKYTANLNSYLERLNELDAELSKISNTLQGKKLLFADRFPFIYMTNDYDIGYISAFSGCSTDVDASFETVIRLAKAVDEEELSYIFVTESSDQKLARAVIAETMQKSAQIVTLDSMQSVTEAQISEGYSYISAMENNILALKATLN